MVCSHSDKVTNGTLGPFRIGWQCVVQYDATTYVRTKLL